MTTLIHSSVLIASTEGLDRLLTALGSGIVAVEILSPGTSRRDWQRTAVSDGFVIVRHPELQTTFAMADRVASELQIIAG